MISKNASVFTNELHYKRKDFIELIIRFILRTSAMIYSNLLNYVFHLPIY